MPRSGSATNLATHKGCTRSSAAQAVKRTCFDRSAKGLLGGLVKSGHRARSCISPCKRGTRAKSRQTRKVTSLSAKLHGDAGKHKTFKYMQIVLNAGGATQFARIYEREVSLSAANPDHKSRHIAANIRTNTCYACETPPRRGKDATSHTEMRLNLPTCSSRGPLSGPKRR